MKRILKYLLYTILGLVAIVLIAVGFAKKEYSVERSVSVNQPRQVVYDYVKYLKNQNDYSVWAKIDPGMKTEFRGKDGTVGFVSENDSTTAIKWEFYGKIKYPMNFMLLFMDMDAMLGKDLQGGLENLKKILEK